MGVATVVVAGTTGLVGGALVPFAAYRLSVEAGESPRTLCVDCGLALPAGWVRPGRCVNCRARLGPPAWVTALIATLSCGLLAGILGARVELVWYVAAALFGVLLSVIDVACQRLPHELVVPAIGVSLVLFTLLATVTGEWSTLARALGGAGVLGGLFLALFALPGQGLGFGDVKLAVLLGGYLGWLGWPEVILGAALPWLINGPVILVLLLTRRISRKSTVPFGPAMLAGALLAILAASALSS
jgi:leader peptidase (prepilin peptidase) / N-methyltransferase